MSNPPSLNQQLYNAVASLAQANDRLSRAIANTETARREETAALNAVNEEQKKFDELVALVKKEAARDTDWKRQPGVRA